MVCFTPNEQWSFNNLIDRWTSEMHLKKHCNYEQDILIQIYHTIESKKTALIGQVVQLITGGLTFRMQSFIG